MKDIFNFGDTWRVTFKRSMWVSLVIFEILAFILSSWLGDIAVMFGLATPDSSSVIVVIGVIAGTMLNEAVHSLWACAAYMFEDIAQTRKLNEYIAELLEQQEKQRTDEKFRIVDDDDDEPVERVLSRHNDTPSYAKQSSSKSSAYIERMRLISERMSENQNESLL